MIEEIEFDVVHWHVFGAPGTSRRTGWLTSSAAESFAA